MADSHDGVNLGREPTAGNGPPSGTIPAVTVTVKRGKAYQKKESFRETFQIGRSSDCEIRFTDREVSGLHAEIAFKEGRWQVRDLRSTNGTYLNGRRIIHETPLPKRAKLEFGLGGPMVVIELEGSVPHLAATPVKPELEDTQVLRETIVGRFVQRHFGDTIPARSYRNTIRIRRVMRREVQRRVRRYREIVAGIAILLVLVGAVAMYQYRKLHRIHLLAENIFYAMKSLELQIAHMEDLVMSSGDSSRIADVLAKRKQRKAMEADYDSFLKELKVYEKAREEDRVIFRVARLFGESEVNMPPEFVKEVHNYIHKWRTTPRLREAIERAKKLGYVRKIAEAMLANDLPPHFFYLGLQESDFDVYRCGPKTRFGVAKGVWQFIPATAKRYGLRVGPLAEFPRPDRRDERHNFDKSTKAAAQYIRDIYKTDAQASGLLVMASYNWGQGNVIEKIRQMPGNPRERNFWRLLKQHQIPNETYNYVFYIFSAAVIGESPRLFGFDFDPPLPPAS